MSKAPPIEKSAVLIDVSLNKWYRILRIDLTIARQLKSIDLERAVIDYNELAILHAPSAFEFVLNDKVNDLIPVQANQTFSIDFYKFNKIFISNDAAAGCAIIWIASRKK